MVSALIQTNMPSTADSSSEEGEDSGEESDLPVVRKQLKLLPSSTSKKATTTGKSRRGRYNATLVVAPTSLLNQWKEELVRSSGGLLSVLVYNDQKGEVSLLDELDGGVDVVVASFGKVGSEWARLTGEESGLFEKNAKEGIYAVEWFRVILDEVS